MNHARSLAFAGLVFALGAVAAAAGCGGNAATPTGGDGGAGANANAACAPCVTDDDCHGGVCTQLGADSYCAPACPNGNECADGRTCSGATSVTGDAVKVCVATSGECAPPDAGSAPSTCGSLVGPSVASSCTSCSPGTKNCQANGCFGGWYCDTSSKKCQPAPRGCGSSGGPVDAGAPVTGQVTGAGGTLSRLLFAVVGDTRPAFIGDTNGYPTKIIDPIFTDVEALKPHPPFVVSTGDYMFAVPFTDQASAQLDLYLAARSKFSGSLFPALGNHECTGSTTSNCGAGNADGVTKNYSAFIAKMLGPIQKTDPWYAIHIDAADGSWTAKLVFVAANAWSDAQATWLESAMAQPTTYTFVVRHESREANTAPGVKPSEAIMAAHPYTLAIVGHTHTYEHYSSSREVVVGNGGAPLTGTKNYGFAVLNQRPDGAIQVDMIDYESGASDTSFRFAVHPDGSPAP